MKLLLILAVGFLVLQSVRGGASEMVEEPMKELKKEENRERPAKYAKPVQLEGAPNLHKVSDILYRSAQPSKVGMKNLKKLGIRTIVNLRSFHSDRDEIGDTDLKYEHIYMKAWHPEKKEIIKFLKIVSDSENTPVLVHCQHGADRTGTMCAVYRMVFQDWTKDDAIKEMKEGGYNFHSVWVNLEPWIKKLDVEKLKKEIKK